MRGFHKYTIKYAEKKKVLLLASKQNRRRMTTRSAMSEYECAIVSTQHSFERLFLFLSFSRSFSLSTREQKETTKTKRSIVYRRERSNDEGSRVSSLSLFLSRVVLFFSLLKRRSDTRPGRPRLFPRTLDRSDFRFVFSSRDCSPGTGVSRRLR